MRASTTTTLLVTLLSVAACDDLSTEPPGLAPPACAMAFTLHRFERIELPENATAANQFGMDLDDAQRDDNAGIDNRLGAMHASMVGSSEGWNVNPAIAGHLAAGRLNWGLEVGRCTDGGAEVRTNLVRATDVDSDGRLEIVARGLPAVGTAGPRLATRAGAGPVPLGFLTDGGGTFATDAWQAGVAFTTDLGPEPGGSLIGKIAFGIGPMTDLAVKPLADYATTAIGAGPAGSYWRGEDRDGDGVISVAEVRRTLDLLVNPDLDLGACDAVDCYRLHDTDGVVDHTSVGMFVVAVPVETE